MGLYIGCALMYSGLNIRCTLAYTGLYTELCIRCTLDSSLGIHCTVHWDVPLHCTLDCTPDVPQMCPGLYCRRVSDVHQMCSGGASDMSWSVLQMWARSAPDVHRTCPGVNLDYTLDVDYTLECTLECALECTPLHETARSAVHWAYPEYTGMHTVTRNCTLCCALGVP